MPSLLTYDNWDAVALSTFNNDVPGSLKGAYRFLMAANTGLWSSDFPNFDYGVICKFGKFLREFFASIVVIYDRRLLPCSRLTKIQIQVRG